MTPTETELEAMRILYRHEQNLPVGEPVSIPPEDQERLLNQVRENAKRVEDRMAKMLKHTITEQRRYPRRHMRFVFLVLLALFAFLFVMAAIFDLVGRV